MSTDRSETKSWRSMIKRPKRGVPEGLWQRCPGCQQTIFRKEAQKRLGVCPECDYHWYVPAQERIRQVLDEGTFEEWDAGLEPDAAGERVHPRIDHVDRALEGRAAAPDHAQDFLPQRELAHVALRNAEDQLQGIYLGDLDDRGAAVIGKALREINLSPNWIVAVIQHGGDVAVPGAEDVIHAGDTLLVVGRHGREGTLRQEEGRNVFDPA